MIGEVAKVVADVAKEVGKKAAEISAEAAKDVAKDAGKTLGEKPVDITKRIDISKAVPDISQKGIDITKRIQPELNKEVSGVDVKQAAKDYFKDLKTKSPCPETLSKTKLDITKLEIQSPERVQELREEFEDNKLTLRKEWEQLNSREWPRYKEDVYNENGIMIRKAGNCYDAHHNQPLQLGGKNEASNLTPLDIRQHSEIHSKNGSCNKLVEAVKGVK